MWKSCSKRLQNIPNTDHSFKSHPHPPTPTPVVRVTKNRNHSSIWGIGGAYEGMVVLETKILGPTQTKKRDWQCPYCSDLVSLNSSQNVMPLTQFAKPSCGNVS